MSSRVLNLRRADACSACGAQLAAGTRAHWNAARRVVTCLPCLERSPVGRVERGEQLERRTERERAKIDRGRAGASAQREYARRRHNRGAKTRERHPYIGGALLALRGTPQHERAFAQGSAGERALGEWLDERARTSGTVMLHDRRMPRGRGNIDHLAIAPSGVYVIDAKAVNGRVRVTRPLIGKPTLRVAGRDRTKFADGLDRQVAAVRGALAAAGRADVPIEGVLCFTKADLPLFGGSRIRGHRLHCRAKLARHLNGRGAFTREQIDELARVLAAALPTA
jgi:Nuclease-related domain